jgi:hypothetical protein
MIEREIYLDFSVIDPDNGSVEIFKYSLSDNINEIVESIMVKTGVLINLMNIKWVRNHGLA